MSNNILSNIQVPSDAQATNGWILPSALDFTLEVGTYNVNAILAVLNPSQNFSQITFAFSVNANDPEAAIFTGNVAMTGATSGGILSGDLTDNVNMSFNNPVDSGVANDIGSQQITVTQAGKLRLVALTPNGGTWTEETAIIIQSASISVSAA